MSPTAPISSSASIRLTTELTRFSSLRASALVGIRWALARPFSVAVSGSSTIIPAAGLVDNSARESPSHGSDPRPEQPEQRGGSSRLTPPERPATWSASAMLSHQR